jgi:hypothetical protein
MTLSILILLAGLTIAGAACDGQTQSYPPVPLPKDISAFGTGIQRTMTLLETSRPEKRNTVRILFYGQSITEQKWSKMVEEYLRRRYPHANLIVENRAIGGFAAQVLVKTAEADLYPFYPDLLIFHVYGSHIDYEKIIENTRRRTTAEILMQTDHITRDEEIDEERDPSKLTPANWSAWMNHVFLPETARKYGVELLDQREQWGQYLRANGLPASRLLSDQVHLNDFGCWLMAELVKQRFRYLPNSPKDHWIDLTRTVIVGKEVKWRGGRLTLPFEGNRVDLIAEEGAPATSPAAILIDGKKPSQIPQLYAFTRSSPYPNTIWPCVMRVAWQKPLVVEEWTAQITEATDDLQHFRFTVRGSVTGPDGEGVSDKPFVSNSGRIVIQPDDWSISRSREFTRVPMPPGFEVKWRVIPLFVDEYQPPSIADKTVEKATTVAQGLPNGRHTLEIVSGDGKPIPLRAIRIYKPPLSP